ncbi:MAG: hypothetical protein EON85_03200 [Brevundimonas sp.]|nr:MAG: hypothetical protein EON85_03200 [Brevundimonas sp.]
MRRTTVAILAFAPLFTACEAASGLQTDGSREAFRSVSQAALRGDQAALDEWVDKTAVVTSLQAQYDELTGHGRWLKSPDASCARWRPLAVRRLPSPQTPLAASELAVFINAGPGAPEFTPVADGKVSVGLPYGVTAAGLELTRRGDRWMVTGFRQPTEIPPPPQFVCEQPLTNRPA